MAVPYVDCIENGRLARFGRASRRKKVPFRATAAVKVSGRVCNQGSTGETVRRASLRLQASVRSSVLYAFRRL